MARTGAKDDDQVKQMLDFDETPFSEDRRCTYLRKGEPDWKATFSDKAIALLESLYFKIVATLVIVVVLIFISKTLFGQVKWTIVDDITADFKPEQHSKSDTKSSKLVVNFWNLCCAGSYGSAVFLFTWMITYMDSVQPGINPPTPVSPRQLRDQSGHTFHMGYVMAFVNGFSTFVLAWWYAL